MSAPNTRAISIASLLTTALTPSTEEGDSALVHVEDTGAVIRVWTHVPTGFNEATRLHVLDFLMSHADRFGHEARRSGSSVLWAEIDQAPMSHPAASKPEEAP
ncbi:hypothetical protein ACIPSE_46990 [Streptomyces sp. NPDC090106]|uniref:hypothetical protein n=1 Tax=Streptomyces sp. NPDC090106 TaxID=3365946 RepID=UPI00381A10E9